MLVVVARPVSDVAREIGGESLLAVAPHEIHDVVAHEGGEPAHALAHVGLASDMGRRRAESPRPMPRSMRPFERICSTASALAVTDGSRVAGFVTHVPSRSFVLFWAMSVSSTYGSFQRTWLSKTQPWLNPACSASFV